MARSTWWIGLHGGLMIGVLLLAGCPTTDTTKPINVAAGVQAKYVVSDGVDVAGVALGTDGRVFYTERTTGKIRVISAAGELLADPFAQVPVNSAGERGLLGIAVHPNFNLNNRIYVFYSRSDTGETTSDSQAILDNRVVYFEADGDVATGGEVFVAAMPAGDTQRIGGRIGFAIDGTLWVAIGDLGDSNNAQDKTVLAGKVLRYNDDGTIPSDNPIADSAVYAWGLRDPQGLTFDPQTGTGFATDRNETKYHEINRILSGGNYGWPSVVGVATTDADKAYVAANPDYVDPVLDSGSDTSPYIGAAFNPSGKYGPNVVLQLFYGVRDTGHLNRAALSSDRTGITGTASFGAGFPTPITDVAFAPAGTLWVASESAILRLDLFP